MTDDDERDEFSVVIFFTDDTHQHICRFVSVEMAWEVLTRTIKDWPLFRVHKVIITDGGDHTNIEWKKGEGFTYPPELVGKVPR